MLKKVKYVKLHDLNVVVPGGIGTVTKELPMASKTLPGLEMFVGEVEGILSVSVSGRKFGIPLANVQFMHFDEENTK